MKNKIPAFRIDDFAFVVAEKKKENMRDLWNGFGFWKEKKNGKYQAKREIEINIDFQ